LVVEGLLVFFNSTLAPSHPRAFLVYSGVSGEIFFPIFLVQKHLLLLINVLLVLLLVFEELIQSSPLRSTALHRLEMVRIALFISPRLFIPRGAPLLRRARSIEFLRQIRLEGALVGLLPFPQLVQLPLPLSPIVVRFLYSVLEFPLLFGDVGLLLVVEQVARGHEQRLFVLAADLLDQFAVRGVEVAGFLLLGVQFNRVYVVLQHFEVWFGFLVGAGQVRTGLPTGAG